MLKSFAPLLGKVIPGITGGAIVVVVLYLIFALMDAEEGERLGIVIKSIIALIVIIFLSIIATLTLSFIFIIIFILATIYLLSQ